MPKGEETRWLSQRVEKSVKMRDGSIRYDP